MNVYFSLNTLTTTAGY